MSGAFSNSAAHRETVVAEARSWLGTPYHHAARLKGIGVDCAMLPAAVYEAAGLITSVTVDHYPPDWHMHRDAERYLSVVLEHATETEAPTGPGDLVLFRWGRAFAHGAIVIAWPTIIHAMVHVGVVLANGDQGRLAGRPHRFFTLWDSVSGRASAAPPTPARGPAGDVNGLVGGENIARKRSIT